MWSEKCEKGTVLLVSPVVKRQSTPIAPRDVLHLCNVLAGWLTVSQWKGMGAVDHYDFCSFTCLQKWVEGQVPRVPKTFLEAFQDE